MALSLADPPDAPTAAGSRCWTGRTSTASTGRPGDPARPGWLRSAGSQDQQRDQPERPLPAVQAATGLEQTARAPRKGRLSVRRHHGWTGFAREHRSTGSSTRASGRAGPGLLSLRASVFARCGGLLDAFTDTRTAGCVPLVNEQPTQAPPSRAVVLARRGRRGRPDCGHRPRLCWSVLDIEDDDEEEEEGSKRWTRRTPGSVRQNLSKTTTTSSTEDELSILEEGSALAPGRALWTPPGSASPTWLTTKRVRLQQRATGSRKPRASLRPSAFPLQPTKTNRPIPRSPLPPAAPRKALLTHLSPSWFECSRATSSSRVQGASSSASPRRAPFGTP